VAFVGGGKREVGHVPKIERVEVVMVDLKPKVKRTDAIQS